MGGLCEQGGREEEEEEQESLGEEWSSLSMIRWTPRLRPPNSWGRGASGDEAITARKAALSTKGNPLDLSTCGSLIVPSRSIRNRIMGEIGTDSAGLNQFIPIVTSIRST